MANSPATMQGTKSNSRLEDITVGNAELLLCVGLDTIVEDVLEALEVPDTLGVVVVLVTAATVSLGYSMPRAY